nr:J98 [uncultured bacterium]
MFEGLGKVQIERHRLHAHALAGHLDQQEQLHALVRLQADDQPVGFPGRGRLRQDGVRHGVEIDHDLGHALGQALAGTQEKRHAGPAPVVDLGLDGDVGFGAAFGRNARLVQVAGHRLAVHGARPVLPAHGFFLDVGGVDRPQGAQNLEFFVAHGIGVDAGRRLHGHDAQQLQHVALHHIAHGAGGVVILAAAFGTDLFGDGDLHVAHRAAVPQRLEDGIAEAQRQQVLHRFLAQVVVDAKDLLFRKDAADRLVDGLGAGQVVAQRFFEHHPGQGRNQSVPGQAFADRAKQPRGGGQIEHPHAACAVLEPGRQGAEAVRVGAVHRQVVDAGAERAPGGVVEIGRGDELAAIVAEHAQVLVAAQAAAGQTQDAPAGRAFVVAKGVIQCRQQLAQGKVAGGTEENHVEALQGTHHGVGRSLGGFRGLASGLLFSCQNPLPGRLG